LKEISTPFFVPASKPFFTNSYKAMISELMSSDPNSNTVRADTLNMNVRQMSPQARTRMLALHRSFVEEEARVPFQRTAYPALWPIFLKSGG
jgi:hypothetical protein